MWPGNNPVPVHSHRDDGEGGHEGRHAGRSLHKPRCKEFTKKKISTLGWHRTHLWRRLQPPKYQPSGVGGTRSLPARLYCLQNPKWPRGSGEGFIPRFLDASINFWKMRGFFIWALLSWVVGGFNSVVILRLSQPNLTWVGSMTELGKKFKNWAYYDKDTTESIWCCFVVVVVVNIVVLVLIVSVAICYSDVNVIQD